MPPAVDLLLPFYGDPGLMRLTVGSVLGQTDPNWRLLVVDDCYPDSSIAGWFENLRDERVIYHRNQHNVGANANYQLALSLASADHIVFLGADDLLLPGYVARARNVLQRMPDATIYQPGVTVIDEHGRPSRNIADRLKKRLRPDAAEVTLLEGEPLARSLLRGNWTYFPSICWRRDAVLDAGFREGLHVAQDLALILDLVLDGHGFVLDPQVTFSYRRHSSSDSAVKALSGERFTEERMFFGQAAEEMERRGWPRAQRAARGRITSRLNALSLVPTALRHGQAATAFGLIRHAVGS